MTNTGTASPAEAAEADVIPTVAEVQSRVPPELDAYEVVDGRVLLTVMAANSHQHVQVELAAELTLWARRTGAVVRMAPFDVPTTPTRKRQPDLLVVTAAHRDRVGEPGMLGAPDLVVEVLSATTRHTDLGDKREEYAGIGVAEYWAIDPYRGYALAAAPPDADWRRVDRGADLASTALEGFAVPLDRILPPT